MKYLRLEKPEKEAFFVNLQSGPAGYSRVRNRSQMLPEDRPAGSFAGDFIDGDG